MLKVAYIKNNSEKEQRIEALARQVVRNHIKRMQKKQAKEKQHKPPEKETPSGT